jgi:hypothetical protein
MAKAFVQHKCRTKALVYNGHLVKDAYGNTGNTTLEANWAL